MPRPSLVLFERLSLAEQWLLMHLPPLLQLRDGEMLQAGRALGNMRVLATPPPLVPAVVLDQAALLAGPAVRREDLRRLVATALMELATARAWQKLGTIGPPVAALFTDDIWNALARSDAIDEQGLVDRVYATAVPDRRRPRDAVPTVRWRVGATPRLLSSSKRQVGRTPVRQVAGEPFITGRLQQGWMLIDACGISKGVVVRPAPDLVRYGGAWPTYEVLSDTLLPEAALASSVGRPIGEIFRHPVIDVLGGTIAVAVGRVKSVRFRVLTGEGQHKMVHPDQVIALSEELKLADKVSDAGADALQRAVGGVGFGAGADMARHRQEEFARMA